MNLHSRDTVSTQGTSPVLFEPAQHGRAAAWLAALMVLAGLTEGAGVVLLVPLLTTLGQNGTGPVAAIVDALGIPARLDLLLAIFVGLVILRGLLVYLRTLAGFRLETAIVDGLRRRAWHALLHADWRMLLVMQRSDTASLLISRVDRAGLFINQAIHAAAISVTLAGIALAALVISPLLSAGAVISGLLVITAFHRMRRRAAQLGEALGKAYSGVHGRLDESLGALRVIKGLGREDKALSDLTGEFAGLRSSILGYQRDAGRGQVALQAGGAALLAVLVWLAIERWHVGVAIVLPMVALFARALPLLGNLQQAMLNCANARPAVRDALQLIAAAEAAREEPAGTTPPPVLGEALVLSNVSVRFAGEARPALDRVSVAIPAKGITALTGPSGAGKSTLADLVGGLLEPDDGEITVDGLALAGSLRQAWRQRVAYVQQDPVLLSASLRENMRWAAPDADDARIEQALLAAAAGFALELPNGLDTMLGDGGRQLSGGERQRLMLARALLRDPALLILDEATSALDTENEQRISEALDRLRGSMAIVVIGHRGVLVGLADQEIRLENGKLAPVA